MCKVFCHTLLANSLLDPALHFHIEWVFEVRIAASSPMDSGAIQLLKLKCIFECARGIANSFEKSWIALRLSASRLTYLSKLLLYRLRGKELLPRLFCQTRRRLCTH